MADTQNPKHDFGADGLSAFLSEAEAPAPATGLSAAAPLPPPEPSGLDAFCDTDPVAEAGAVQRAPVDPRVPCAAPATTSGSAVVLWWRPAVVPWFAPAAAVVLAGAIGVLWGLHLAGPVVPEYHQESSKPVAIRDLDMGATSIAADRVRREPLPIMPPTASAGLPADALRSFPQVRVPLTAAAATSGRTPIRSARGERPAPVLSTKAPSARPATDAAPANPLAPLVHAPQPGDARLVDAARLDGPATPPPAAISIAARETAAAEQAVRRTLHSYEEAYEGLNVAAAAAIWPTVDRRALTRAFATLKSQGLDFQSCAIAVSDASATAYCRGTLQFVRRVGNALPLIAEQQWLFRMRRAGSDWKIDDVSATQVHPIAAPRPRGQG